LKSLVAVKFLYRTDAAGSSSTSEPDAICPSCKKDISNATIAYHIRSCHDVVCKACTDALVRPGGQCVVCDQKVKPKDIVELAREGTGYAAGGRAETTKTGVAFQG